MNKSILLITLKAKIHTTPNLLYKLTAVVVVVVVARVVVALADVATAVAVDVVVAVVVVDAAAAATNLAPTSQYRTNSEASHLRGLTFFWTRLKRHGTLRLPEHR